MRAPSRRLALGMMVAAPVMWSSAGAVTRHIELATAFEQVFWRSLFAFLFVSGFLVSTKRNPLREVRAARGPGLFSGAMWAVMFTAFVIALSLTSTANTLVTMSIAPFLTAILARLLLADAVPARTWIAAGASTAGIAWMFHEGLAANDGRHFTGMLVALLVPVASAANLVMLRAARARVDFVPAVLIGAALSCLIAAPLAMPWSGSARDIALLAFLGIFQLGLPCMLLVLASRSLLAPEIALLGLLEVVLGPLWAWLGAGETPAAATFVGGVVVLAGVAGNELAGFRRIITAKLSVTRISG